LAVAPVGSVLLAAAVGADFEAVDDLAAAGAASAGAAAAGAAAVASAAGLLFEAFFTPPWPLQAPRPVAVEVVPSLQVVGAPESAARAGRLNANTIKGSARIAPRFGLFMKLYSLVYCDSAMNCKRFCAIS
jgi:hypothetical protein